MSNNIRKFITTEILESLDVPASAYEAAERRYDDLGKWLKDSTKAACKIYSPHVFPQGSFRLGTVIKPWKRGEYDLDLAYKLQDGISKISHTQLELKNLVFSDLNNYRKDRRIQEALDEKRRCWRLHYQDQLKFHMDIVPGIPEAEDSRQILQERMISAGQTGEFAQLVAALAMSITDNEKPNYRVNSQDWEVSNPEGYALWFESRMRKAQLLLEKRAALENVAKIDDLPAHRWKTPLQKCIQILKRHRDVMFEADPKEKPISVIITTLAAKSYQGETDLESAITRIISRMGGHINSIEPRVPNPVNPKEDFADKWKDNPRLEQNFQKWLRSVQAHFEYLAQIDAPDRLSENILQNFGVRIDSLKLKKHFGLIEKATAITAGTAFTDKDGVIGNTGVENKPHQFYG